MASIKTLSGVAHDIAHHSQSGLSWLHPHLRRACQSVGVNRIAFELLNQPPYPLSLPKLEPLEYALSDLQAKFWQMIELKQLPRDCVVSAQLEFLFPPTHDDYTCSVSATITASNGKVFARRVGVSW